MRIRTEHLLLFLLLLTGQLFGQSNSPIPYTQNDLQDLANSNPNISTIRSFNHRSDGIKGTPFLSEDWQKGTLKLEKQNEFGQEVPIRLDLREQLLYFQLANGAVRVLPSNNLQALRIYTEKGQYRLFRIYPESEIEGTKNQQLKFYEVLFEGPYVLLKLHYKEIRKVRNQGALSTDLRMEEFIDQSTLWLQEAGKSFHKVKLKNKSIEKALPAQVTNIQKLISSERIDISREADLIRLLHALEKLK